MRRLAIDVARGGERAAGPRRVGSSHAAAALAGLRLALLDGAGDEVAPMSDDAVADMGGRRFPAHLDTRHSDEGWWHGPHRYGREQPWYTFDRDRRMRDRTGARDGTPDDHQLPQPGDSPAERAEARRRERLAAAGGGAASGDSWPARFRALRRARSSAPARPSATNSTTGPAGPSTRATARVAATSA